MKIVFVTRAYWPAVGGQENYLRHVATGLTARHDVKVVAQTKQSVNATRLLGLLRDYPAFSSYRDGEVLVQELRLDLRRRVWILPALATVIRPFSRYAYHRFVRRGLAQLLSKVIAPDLRRALEDADVIHMWGGDLLSSVVLDVAHELGTPVVLTPFAHPGQHGDDPFSASCYRRADRVVGLLHCDAALYGNLGVAADRLRVCPVCSPGLPESDVDARAEHGILGPLILFLAVRRAYKGLDLLLEAIPTIAARVPDATIAIAGPGDPVDVDRPLRVIDVGALTAQRAVAWLRAADVLCLPSEHEIFPVSFLEAWSAGTAVVGSDIEPLRELLGESGGGLAVPRDPASLGEALGALLRDRDRCRALGAAGCEWWRAHALPGPVVACHEKIYAEVLGARTAPPSLAAGG
ncbi:MAG: glycosyltransferase family 4 protein [Solirubrobacteraceae bacterium]